MGISSHASLAIGLILALVTAAAFNWSWVAQHTITSRLPPLTIRHPWRSLALLFGHRRWLFAFMIGIAGWALYILALRLAPLSLVQAVSAGGLALLAVLAQRAEGIPLPRREWAGVWLAVAGLVFLSVSLAGGGNESSHGSWAAVTAWFLVSFVGVGIAIGPGARYLVPGAGFGLAAGLMYAAADVGTKAAVQGASDRRRRHDLPRDHAARFPGRDAVRRLRLRGRRRGRGRPGRAGRRRGRGRGDGPRREARPQPVPAPSPD